MFVVSVFGHQFWLGVSVGMSVVGAGVGAAYFVLLFLFLVATVSTTSAGGRAVLDVSRPSSGRLGGVAIDGRAIGGRGVDLATPSLGVCCGSKDGFGTAVGGGGGGPMAGMGISFAIGNGICGGGASDGNGTCLAVDLGDKGCPVAAGFVRADGCSSASGGDAVAVGDAVGYDSFGGCCGGASPCGSAFCGRGKDVLGGATIAFGLGGGCCSIGASSGNVKGLSIGLGPKACAVSVVGPGASRVLAGGIAVGDLVRAGSLALGSEGSNGFGMGIFGDGNGSCPGRGIALGLGRGACSGAASGGKVTALSMFLSTKGCAVAARCVNLGGVGGVAVGGVIGSAGCARAALVPGCIGVATECILGGSICYLGSKVGNVVGVPGGRVFGVRVKSGVCAFAASSVDKVATAGVECNCGCLMPLSKDKVGVSGAETGLASGKVVVDGFGRFAQVRCRDAAGSGATLFNFCTDGNLSGDRALACVRGSGMATGIGLRALDFSRFKVGCDLSTVRKGAVCGFGCRGCGSSVEFAGAGAPMAFDCFKGSVMKCTSGRRIVAGFGTRGGRCRGGRAVDCNLGGGCEATVKFRILRSCALVARGVARGVLRG